MTRAFRSLAGAGVGVVNAPGIGVAGTVELSVARVGVELISAYCCDLLHPATSRGKTTTNATKLKRFRRRYTSGNKVRISSLKENFEIKYLLEMPPIERSCAPRSVPTTGVRGPRPGWIAGRRRARASPPYGSLYRRRRGRDIAVSRRDCVRTWSKTYPRDRASATKNIFDKALAVPQGIKLEDCIENR